MAESYIRDLIITLLINGFHLDNFKRISLFFNLQDIYKYDNFGAEIKYTVLVCRKKPSASILETLDKQRKRKNSKAFIICNDEVETEFDIYTYDDFYNKIGGVVNVGLVLNPNLPELMGKLGLNILPNGIEGSPDDLLEIYSKECLQFLFKSPARRYGKDRSFESLPDGVLLVKNTDAYLIDSKAYKKGFEFRSDDINRFEKYIKDFERKYGHLFNVRSFIVVSGKFNDSKESILSRSTDLLSRSRVPISCVESTILAQMVVQILANPEFHPSIDWNSIFVKPTIALSSLTNQIKRIKKDKIITT